VSLSKTLNPELFTGAHRSGKTRSNAEKNFPNKRINKKINYLRIENAEGYVLIAVYLFMYLYACYSHKSKSIKPNRMKFGGMIGYYPGTI